MSSNDSDTSRHINTRRHPIPDVPVLYLLEPTPMNLAAITADLSKGLYSPAYINFLSSIPRPLMEDFAAQTIAAGTGDSIAQIYEPYLNFIVGEPDLFSLGMRKENTYWALNSAKASDQELDNVVDKVVSGLFSVIVTMGMLLLSSRLPYVDVNRCDSDHKMSERRSRRDDCLQTRPETQRPYSRLKSEPLLRIRQPTCFITRHCFVTTCVDHSRQECGSDTYAFALVDISITSTRCLAYAAEQDHGRDANR